MGNISCYCKSYAERKRGRLGMVVLLTLKMRPVPGRISQQLFDFLLQIPKQFGIKKSLDLISRPSQSFLTVETFTLLYRPLMRLLSVDFCIGSHCCRTVGRCKRAAAPHQSLHFTPSTSTSSKLSWWVTCLCG